ncbi:peptidase family C78-domain-containing protein [Leucosporidium creatinivorum]|uniref:Peptidase family C78-domain-containing protein n=1 Tax=Leucosporidium creatinivorum TaxID=106004 RepID=A0A1Y2D7A9_9BASI|nr:peptidase family C78-domain-containing protein [Leucosporidium creatinivorum]
MSSLECFVCHELVRGDAAYQEHHLNRCLDTQAAGVSTPSMGSNSANTASQSADGRAGTSNGLQHNEATSPATTSITTSSDELLARALAEQIDAEAAAALSASDAHTSLAAVETGASHQWVDYDPQGAAAASSSSSAGCPLCGLTWETLGLGASQGGREEHAAACLEDEGGQGDDWEDLPEESTSKSTILGKKKPTRPKPKFDWSEAGRGQTAVKGTAGLVRVLHSLLSRSHAEGKTKVALLANESVEHIVQGNFREMTYACGYRNAQMMFSSLRHLDAYSSLNDPSPNLPPIPTILELQNIIELAWNQGYDPPGRDHFKGKLIGSTKWIGATEIYTAMSWLGIRVKIIDFPKVPGSGNGTHGTLVSWIRDYFETPLPTSPTGAKRPLPSTDGTETNALAALMASKGSAIKYTSKQPLYLQHQGHSRTVVGIEVSKSGDWLLIYDPAKRVSITLAGAAAAASPPSATKTLHPPPKRSNTQSSASNDDESPSGSSNALGLSTSAKEKDKSEAAFWAQTPGAAQMEGVKTGKKGVAGSGGAKGWATGSSSSVGAGGGGGKGAGGLDLKLYAKMLEPYRVSLSSLGKKDEYQIVYVEDGPPLTQKEIRDRKMVKSTRITASK